VSFFEHWVEPGFTASLENQLDEVAAGEVDWKQVLRDFWTQFHARVAEVEPRRPSEVIEALDAFLGPALFPRREDGSDPRACPLCGTGRLSLKLGKFGGFIGCSNYPECRFTRQLGEGEAEAQSKERLLGVDPANAEEVWLRTGRFGPYVQRGQGEDAKRCSLPRGMSPGELDLATALRLLSLPREIGPHPETGQMITAGIGRYGAYVECGGRYVTLPADENVLEIGINRATVLLAEGGKGKGRGARPAAEARELGKHPKDGQPVSQGAGRFGPYVRHGKLFASIPKAIDPAAVTLEQALALLAAKAGKPKSDRPAKAAKAKGNGAATESVTARAKPPAKARPKPVAKDKSRPAPKAKAAASPRRAARTRS
jgi:DNA topoisomerase-1